MAVDCIFFQFPGVPGVYCAFQGRGLGNISFKTGEDPASVVGARERLAELLRQRGMEAWCECSQVHGREILTEPEPTEIDARVEIMADGMMTSRPHLGLLIKTADCQPLLLAHKSGRYVMALHVGWRANLFNFPAIGIAAFCRQYAVNPDEIVAVRGPSLGNAEFVNFDSEWGSEFERWYHRDTACMNLWALTRHQLMQAGVPPEQIYGLDICTQENSREFFSYRCERNAGRQGSIVWID